MTTLTELTTTATFTLDAIDLAAVDDLDTLDVIERAEWLREHGAAHLPLIERIELAERITRRRFIIGAGALVLGSITGCDASGTFAPDAPVAATRTVVDGQGRSVEVPAHPQRVITIDAGRVTYHLVELGLPPVAATSRTSDAGTFPLRVGDMQARIEVIGDVTAPSLEQIAALKPDLILYAFVYDSVPFDTLSTIAPTVAYDAVGVDLDVEASLRFVAEVVNRREAAERIIGDFNAKLEQAGSNPNIAGKTFSIVEAYSNTSFAVYGPEFIMGRMVTRLGGEIVPKEVDGTPLTDASTELSLERVPNVVNADIILSLQYLDGEQKTMSDVFVGSAVWQALPAVQRGDVVVLDSHAAFGSYGFVGLDQVLDQLSAFSSTT